MASNTSLKVMGRESRETTMRSGTETSASTSSLSLARLSTASRSRMRVLPGCGAAPIDICAARARKDSGALAGSKSDSSTRVPVTLTARKSSIRGTREA